jgi:hypothetical protein
MTPNKYVSRYVMKNLYLPNDVGEIFPLRGWKFYNYRKIYTAVSFEQIFTILQCIS